MLAEYLPVFASAAPQVTPISSPPVLSGEAGCMCVVHIACLRLLVSPHLADLYFRTVPGVWL